MASRYLKSFIKIDSLTSNLVSIGKQSAKTILFFLMDKWKSKTLFLSILIRVRRLLRALSIAAYPVWVCDLKGGISWSYSLDISLIKDPKGIIIV